MKIVNIDRNNRSGEKFTILGIVGLGSFTTIVIVNSRFLERPQK